MMTADAAVDTVDLSCWSKLGVQIVVQEKIHTLIIPSQRFFLAQPRQTNFSLLILTTTVAAFCFILYGLLPIVLWIVALIVQTLQRQQQQHQQQEAPPLSLQQDKHDDASSSSSPTVTIMLAQQVYQITCYWTYHVVPRLTASLLTLYIAFCLAYVGWLKVVVQEERSVRVRQ